MSTSSSTQQQQNLKTGTVYTKIADFLDSNSVFDPEPVPIRSSNLVTNPYTQRKKRRYVDTIGDALPPSLSHTIIGQCYHKLRKLEHELDVSISKRYSHVTSQLQTTTQHMHERSVTRVLRCRIDQSTVDNATSDTNEWQCTLSFSVLDPRRLDRAINATDDPLEYAYYRPLQSLISRMVLTLDAASLDAEETRPSRIEWNNAHWKHHRATAASANKHDDNDGSKVDGFEITRRGHQDCALDIEIYLMHWFIPFEDATTTDNRSHNNQKNKKIKPSASSVIYNHASALCKLSAPLASMLGLDFGHAVRYHTKSDVLQSLACYVKMNGLIRGDHSMAIDCDEPLQRVLGAKTVYCGNLWKMLVLKKHILPPEPLRIRHEVRLNSASTSDNTYDMLVKVPSLTAIKASRLIDTAHDLHNVSQPNGYATTIDALNVQISDVMQEITEQREEKQLYEEYAKDPVSTIDVIVSNQRENLQIIKEFAENAKIKPCNFFADPSVQTDIKRFLKKKQLQQK